MSNKAISPNPTALQDNLVQHDITALEYARTLKKPKDLGEPLSSYLPFANLFPKEDILEMKAAIDVAFPIEEYDDK